MTVFEYLAAAATLDPTPVDWAFTGLTESPTRSCKPRLHRASCRYVARTALVEPDPFTEGPVPATWVAVNGTGFETVCGTCCPDLKGLGL